MCTLLPQFWSTSSFTGLIAGTHSSARVTRNDLKEKKTQQRWLVIQRQDWAECWMPFSINAHLLPSSNDGTTISSATMIRAQIKEEKALQWTTPRA